MFICQLKKKKILSKIYINVYLFLGLEKLQKYYKTLRGSPYWILYGYTDYNLKH